MFRSASGKQRASSQFETLVFGQELTSRPGEVFNASQVDGFGYDGELACVAFDPLQSLLAVATKSGRCCIYGKHGVPRLSWSLRPAQAIKNLLLKAGSSCAILIDARDTLHVYDLSNVDNRGEPERLMAHSMRAGVNCIEFIPSLSHVFLGCQDGTIETLDVDRLRISPYRIRNLWTEQEDLLRRSGIKGGTAKKRVPPCTDVKTNPLDPNQMLIAYPGGVVLYDLSEQRSIRTYEYIVLPGAPGGHNDQTEGAFLERRPSCMCLAWRPDGRMFVSGHDDGSIVFWAVEDGDKPVMARTIAMEDVNMATSSSLFGEDAHSPVSAVGSMREPVFKLAWSAFTEANSGLFDRFTGSGTPDLSSGTGTSTPSRKPSTGGTLLTVLGGLKADEPKGLHVLHLPAFSAPSMLGGSGAADLKSAYRASTSVSYKSVLTTDTVPEDFTLLTSNPYYSQANDPYAVIILTAADPELPRIAPHTERGFIAYDFPPAGLAGPTELDLPVEMQLSGSQAVLVAEAITLPSFAHKRLKDETGHTRLPLHGGDGKVIMRSNAPASRSGALHHAVLTVHLDMTIRIWDYTTPTAELLDSFSVRDALSDDQLMRYLEGRMWIEKVSPSWETSEIAVALSTGEVLLYRFDYAKAGAAIQQQQVEDAQFYNTPLVRVETTRLELERVATRAAALGLNDNKSFFGRKKSTNNRTSIAAQQQSLTSFEVDVVDISARSDWSKNGFKPIFALIAPKLRERRVTALSMSQAGFLAVAWNEKLAVIDLRGPELLYNEGSDRADSGGIALLTWMTCAEGDDPERLPRLLASYGSGLNRLFTLSYVLDTWIVNTAFATFDHTSLQAPLAAFAMDPHGNSLPLNGTTLEATLKAQSRGPMHSTGSGSLNSLLFVISELSLNVKANVTGERLVKRDFTPHKAVAAQVVWRHGMPILVVLLADGKCSIYALPKCEEIKTFRMSFERARPSISPDGRILQTLSPTLFEMTTIFTDQAVSRTKCSYHDATKLLPVQPSSSVLGAATSAATSYIASWFGGEAAKAVGASNLDDLLGGPHRPPQQMRSAAVQGSIDTAQATAVGTSPGRPARGRPVAPPPAAAGVVPARGGSGSLAAIAGGGRVAQTDHVEVEYDRFGRVKKRHELTDALEERGERLGFVNEQLDKASTASTNFVEQARRTAMLQSGKMALTGAGKGAMAGVSAGFSKLIG